MKPSQHFRSIRYMPAFNQASEDIPPYGVVAINSTITNEWMAQFDGGAAINVEKPVAGTHSNYIAVNGPLVLPYSATSVKLGAITKDWPVPARVGSYFTYNNRHFCGLGSGFSMVAGVDFSILGYHRYGGVYYVEPNPCNSVMVCVASSVTAGTVYTVEILNDISTLTGVYLQAVAGFTSALSSGSSGQAMLAVRGALGRWILTCCTSSLSCSPASSSSASSSSSNSSSSSVISSSSSAGSSSAGSSSSVSSSAGSSSAGSSSSVSSSAGSSSAGSSSSVSSSVGSSLSSDASSS